MLRQDLEMTSLFVSETLIGMFASGLSLPRTHVGYIVQLTTDASTTDISNLRSGNILAYKTPPAAFGWIVQLS